MTLPNVRHPVHVNRNCTIHIYIGIRRIDDVFELLPYVRDSHYKSVAEAVNSVTRMQRNHNPINVRFYVMRDFANGMFEVASSIEGQYPVCNYVQHGFKS